MGLFSDLLTFKGGVHPPTRKERTNHGHIEVAPPPSRVIIPVAQHIGAPADVVVKKREQVKRGQVIAAAQGFVSAPVHASTSGKVKDIGPAWSSNGQRVPCVTIEADGEDTWADDVLVDRPDFMELPPEELRQIIFDAGIVGLGGAAFPSHVKLAPPKEKRIHTVILNGVECEPYLTADHLLMLERGEEVVAGLKLIMRVVGAEKGIIGIEANKPDAIRHLKQLTKGDKNIRVVALQVKYPQGGEKQLIYAVTRKEVPSGGLPMDLGIVMNNVGTAAAMYRACRYGEPLTERVTTVTGDGVVNPRNFLARIGTPFGELIELCGGFQGEPGAVINGGPMMGIAVPSLDVPVIKGTSGILVLRKEELPPRDYEPCIRCGMCVRGCPVQLVPSALSDYGEHRMLEELEDYHIFDCIECGSCSYVCPSKRPIVQFIRYGKREIIAEREKKRARQAAREEAAKQAEAGETAQPEEQETAEVTA
ncbi:MAG: electron transport complex subunit RsxC [Nitrospirae bacterium]|nr:MAG: electron transport complex subunit RsxC [Nitrospirota bacterium]